MRCLIPLLTLVVSLVGCDTHLATEADATAGSAHPTTTSAATPDVTFQVPTNSWRPGRAGMQAHLQAILRFTSDGCPHFTDKGTSKRVTWLAFPADAIGIKTSDGKRHVTGQDGYIYGTEGRLIDYSGGAMWAKDIKNTCGEYEGNVYGFAVQGGPTTEWLDLDR